MVNAAIGIRPLFAVMKVAAKQVLKSTAERNGIPWDDTVQQLQNTPEVLLPSRLQEHSPMQKTLKFGRLFSQKNRHSTPLNPEEESSPRK